MMPDKFYRDQLLAMATTFGTKEAITRLVYEMGDLCV